MIKDRKVAGVLMMREGSERILDKCVKPFLGRPLALIALEKLRRSKYIDTVAVSTSSARYKALVERWGFQVIDRPAHLSEGRVVLADVIRNVASQMDWLGASDYLVHVDICCPQGTVEAIDQVIEAAAAEPELDSCFAVRELEHSLTDDLPVSSQDRLPRFCHFNFCRLRTRAAAMQAHGWGYGQKHKNIALVGRHWIDIDTPEDWFAAAGMVLAGL